MRDEKIFVEGCPFCEMIKNKKFNTKLYYPPLDILDSRTLIIIDSPFNGKPIAVATEHIPSLSKTEWGYMLYHARRLFGQGVYLRKPKDHYEEHFHCEITHVNVNPKSLPDYRYAKDNSTG